MTQKVISFRNQIEEASRTGDMKDATTLLSMEIEIQCEGIDHANKLLKQITAGVEKALKPQTLDDREF